MLDLSRIGLPFARWTTLLHDIRLRSMIVALRPSLSRSSKRQYHDIIGENKVVIGWTAWGPLRLHWLDKGRWHSQPFISPELASSLFCICLWQTKSAHPAALGVEEIGSQRGVNWWRNKSCSEIGVLTKIKFEGEVMVVGSFALWYYSGLRHEWSVREGISFYRMLGSLHLETTVTYRITSWTWIYPAFTFV